MCFDLTRFACGCTQTTHRACSANGLGAITGTECTTCSSHRHLDVDTLVQQRGRPHATRSACTTHPLTRIATGACGHSAPRSEMWRVHRYDGSIEQLVCRHCAGPLCDSPRAT
jgi:hypothetical protein